MVVPMAGLALLLGIGGSWAITAAVEAVNDRILSAASQAIAESLAVEDGEITLHLPPSAFAMLEDAERDNVYYSISYGNAVISGYADLPKVPLRTRQEGDVTFATTNFRGHQVRLVAEDRRLPRINGLVTVEVAETTDARDRVVRDMLLMLAVLEGLLIALAAILIPVAVRWGLSPLLELRSEMDRRGASDFTPLPVSNVPAELRDFVGTFNSLLGRLDAAVQGMRRFTADASHQMRTPISILRTHVAALKKAKPGSAEAASSLTDIDDATGRLQNLLVQLLALARADSAATVNEALKPLDLVEAARQVANDHAGLALRHKAKLQFIAPAQAIVALSHPALIAELLANLLDNAIRYNERGKLVSVEVSERDGVPRVCVEDGGPGIPMADRERVFERFTRLQPERDKIGTGLGLSIVRSLADTIGAKITICETATGRGLRIEVAFQPVA